MELPTRRGVEDAEKIVRRFIPETPLVRSELLSRSVGSDVWLKIETISPIASFKLRGALTAIQRALDRGAVAGVCTSSTGNHAQGVAYAARLLGLNADIFLPVGANAVKRRMIEAFGARIHQTGSDLDEAKTVAKDFSDREGSFFVDDGESLDLMEGAGTVGLEIGRTLTGIDAMFVPMGSGTLATGVAAAAKSLQPQARIIAVQAKGSPAMVDSFHAGRAVERPIDTVADGLVCRIPAMRALAGLKAYVDDAILVEDSALLSAIRGFAELAHLLVEPAGAAGLAGALQLKGSVSGKKIVLVVTGANITMECLRQALQIDRPDMSLRSRHATASAP